MEQVVEALKNNNLASITWTKHGSDERLLEKLHEAIEHQARHRPNTGLVMFHRLPDGGYEIKSWSVP